MRQKPSYESIESPCAPEGHPQGGQFRVLRESPWHALEHYRAIEAETAPQLLEDYLDSLVWGPFPEDCDC